MKKKILLGLIYFFPSTMVAQSLADKSLEDSILGWVKVYHLKGVQEGKKMDARFFSAAQMSVMDSFVNWMQASYIPKAGMGDMKKSIFPKANQYRPYEAILPQGFGAVAHTWSVNWENGKIARIPETDATWAVLANSVPSEWGIASLCDNEHFYFTMPTLDATTDATVKTEQDLSNVPNIKPYIYLWIHDIETGGGTENVFLCKDNHLPFIKITKGEYLDALEKGITKTYEAEKKKIYRDNPGNQKSIDYFMGYLDDKNKRRVACLKNNKEKYKDRLNETAEVFTYQPDVLLENYKDVFEGNGGSSVRLPVYRLDPAMFERCKKDAPQWIRIVWGWHAANAKTKYLHESIINNFNFDYVYNFFFAPEKVKGTLYQPLHAPYSKEKMEATEISSAAKNAAADKSIFFFEDFSSNAEGQKPVGWFSKLSNTGSNATVTTIENVKGKWLAIKGNELVPALLKKPLPENFTITYDVAVPQNFTWGGKRLDLTLSAQKTTGINDSYITLTMRPGFDGKDGSASVESKLPAGYAAQGYFDAPGFSNNKRFNVVPVRIKKNGEALQIWINTTIVAEYPKAIPGDIHLNSLSFLHLNSNSETEKYFISNIKITKE